MVWPWPAVNSVNRNTFITSSGFRRLGDNLSPRNWPQTCRLSINVSTTDIESYINLKKGRKYGESVVDEASIVPKASGLSWSEWSDLLGPHLILKFNCLPGTNSQQLLFRIPPAATTNVVPFVNMPMDWSLLCPNVETTCAVHLSGVQKRLARQ